MLNIIVHLHCKFTTYNTFYFFQVLHLNILYYSLAFVGVIGCIIVCWSCRQFIHKRMETTVTQEHQKDKDQEDVSEYDFYVYDVIT